MVHMHPVSNNPAPQVGPSGRDSAAWLAAVVNGSLILVVPAILTAAAIFRSEALLPAPPTLQPSVAGASRVMLGLSPIAAIVVWRTYVRAHAYRLSHRGMWRGPVESALMAGGIATLIMLRATSSTWGSQPSYLVAA